MKIIKSIRKMWLQHRVYKYSLKAQDSLSKSEQYLKLSLSLMDLHPHPDIDDLKLIEKYTIKSGHYKRLADIYQDKKTDLEEKLCNFTYRRV